MSHASVCRFYAASYTVSETGRKVKLRVLLIIVEFALKVLRPGYSTRRSIGFLSFVSLPDKMDVVSFDTCFPVKETDSALSDSSRCRAPATADTESIGATS